MPDFDVESMITADSDGDDGRSFRTVDSATEQETPAEERRRLREQAQVERALNRERGRQALEYQEAEPTAPPAPSTAPSGRSTDGTSAGSFQERAMIRIQALKEENARLRAEKQTKDKDGQKIKSQGDAGSNERRGGPPSEDPGDGDDSGSGEEGSDEEDEPPADGPGFRRSKEHHALINMATATRAIADLMAAQQAREREDKPTQQTTSLSLRKLTYRTPPNAEEIARAISWEVEARMYFASRFNHGAAVVDAGQAAAQQAAQEWKAAPVDVDSSEESSDGEAQKLTRDEVHVDVEAFEKALSKRQKEQYLVLSPEFCDKFPVAIMQYVQLRAQVRGPKSVFSFVDGLYRWYTETALITFKDRRQIRRTLANATGPIPTKSSGVRNWIHGFKMRLSMFEGRGLIVGETYEDLHDMVEKVVEVAGPKVGNAIDRWRELDKNRLPAVMTKKYFDRVLKRLTKFAELHLPLADDGGQKQTNMIQDGDVRTDGAPTQPLDKGAKRRENKMIKAAARKAEAERVAAEHTGAPTVPPAPGGAGPSGAGPQVNAIQQPKPGEKPKREPRPMLPKPDVAKDIVAKYCADDKAWQDKMTQKGVKFISVCVPFFNSKTCPFVHGGMKAHNLQCPKSHANAKWAIELPRVQELYCNKFQNGKCAVEKCVMKHEMNPYKKPDKPKQSNIIMIKETHAIQGGGDGLWRIDTCSTDCVFGSTDAVTKITGKEPVLTLHGNRSLDYAEGDVPLVGSSHGFLVEGSKNIASWPVLKKKGYGFRDQATEHVGEFIAGPVLITPEGRQIPLVTDREGFPALDPSTLMIENRSDDVLDLGFLPWAEVAKTDREAVTALLGDDRTPIGVWSSDFTDGAMPRDAPMCEGWMHHSEKAVVDIDSNGEVCDRTFTASEYDNPIYRVLFDLPEQVSQRQGGGALGASGARVQFQVPVAGASSFFNQILRDPIHAFARSVTNGVCTVCGLVACLCVCSAIFGGCAPNDSSASLVTDVTGQSGALSHYPGNLGGLPGDGNLFQPEVKFSRRHSFLTAAFCDGCSEQQCGKQAFPVEAIDADDEFGLGDASADETAGLNATQRRAYRLWSEGRSDAAKQQWLRRAAKANAQSAEVPTAAPKGQIDDLLDDPDPDMPDDSGAEIEILGELDGANRSDARRVLEMQRQRKVGLKNAQADIAAVLSKRGLSDEAAKVLLHRICSHVPYDPCCQQCVDGKGKRKPTSRKANLQRELQPRSWTADLTFSNVPGPLLHDTRISGATCALNIVDLESDYTLGGPVKNPMGVHTLATLRVAAAEIGEAPLTLSTGHDTNFDKNTTAWVDSQRDAVGSRAPEHIKRDRYSPMLLAVIERRQGIIKDGVRTECVPTNRPLSVWALAWYHVRDTRNIMTGAWARKHGADDAPLKNAGPFGSLCKLHKEKPETEGVTWESRAVDGIHCGYAPGSRVRVAIKTANGFRFIVSRHVDVFPDVDYFTKYDYPERDVAVQLEFRAGQKPQGAEYDTLKTRDVRVKDTRSWVEVSCCEKWREVDQDDRANLQFVAEVRCDDLVLPDGTVMSCNFPQDPAAFEETLIAEDATREVQLFEQMKKSQVFNDTPWDPADPAGPTYRQKAEEALAKELQAYSDFHMFDETVVHFAEDLPEGTHVVDYNDVWGEKGVELRKLLPQSKDRRIKLRIVAWRERYVGKQYKISGIKDGEFLATYNPSPDVMRLVIVYGAVAFLVQEGTDMLNGYFQSRAGDEDTGNSAYANLPDSLWSEEWNRKYGDRRGDLHRRPLLRLLGGQYGRDRAAPDFDKHCTAMLNSIGFIADQDVEPCLYRCAPTDVKTVIDAEIKRGVDRTPLGEGSTHVSPHTVLRYTDDNETNLHEHEHAGIWERIDSVIKSQKREPMDGAKFVGLRYHIVHHPEKGYCEVGFDAREYASLLVDEFESEVGVVKERDAPGPVATTMYGTAGEVRAAADGAAKNEESKPGVHAGRSRHWVGALLFLMRIARPDLAYPVIYLAGLQETWDADADRHLLWIFGFLKKTRNFLLCGKVFYVDLWKLSVLLETDGSHAGCTSSRKGVSGFLVYLVGPGGSRILISWGCKKQTTVSISSGETELFAMLFGTKMSIKLLMVLHILGGFDAGSAFFHSELKSDSTVALAAVHKGASEGLRHVRRTAGVSIAWLHAIWCGAATRASHMPGVDISADALTKHLAAATLRAHQARMGLVDTPV